MPSMALTCFICNLPMESRSYSAPQGKAAHNKCRKANEGLGVRTHGQGGYKRGCRCEVCVSAKREAMQRFHARHMEDHGISQATAWKRKNRGTPAWEGINCFICQEPLKRPPQSERRPMHKACRAAAPNWLRYDLPNPKIEAFKRKIEQAAAGTIGKRVFTCGGCEWCGEYFVGIGKFCSRKCGGTAKFTRRSSGNAFKVSPRERLAIYERDNWTCQLCKYPVDPNLKHPDIWSASLDHIIPQSVMLIPDHSPSNLRLAHLWCNSARGDGSNMTEAVFLARIASMEVAA